MKILIALTTCHAFRERAAAVRATWGADVAGADLVYFLGRPPDGADPCQDQVALDCPDGYHFLAAKTQLIRRWALAHGYDYLWKVDDDVYVRPERLLALSGPDYIGRLRGPACNYRAPYCSGFCYGLSRRSMLALSEVEWQEGQDFAEDRWTGNQLLELGISPTHEPRLGVTHSKRTAISHREAPLVNNGIAASCEYAPETMRDVHHKFRSGEPSRLLQWTPPGGRLTRVAILIKTFLRDGYLFRCLDGLQRNFPEVKIVVVDDGAESADKIRRYAELRDRGHACIWLPFDSGFGSKANAGLVHCDREYVLIGSDDFDFSERSVRPGVERMLQVLDARPALGVASGRVDGRPYEYVWRPGQASLEEVAGYHGSGEIAGTRFHLCDLTVNYSLVRRKVFEGGIHWDAGVKIGGGEHAAFFVDLQRAYWGVAYVEGADIRQMPHMPAWKDHRYDQLRRRASRPGRVCLKRRGIDRYVLADGTVEVS